MSQNLDKSVGGTHSSPPPPATECSVCLDFDWAERDAERMGDLSTATDWRVLRRRHQIAEHPEQAPISFTD